MMSAFCVAPLVQGVVAPRERETNGPRAASHVMRERARSRQSRISAAPDVHVDATSWRYDSAAIPIADHIEPAVIRLKKLPVLVSPGDVHLMTRALTKAANGEAFVFMAGSSVLGDSLDSKSMEGIFRLLVAQVIVLTYLSGLPTVKVGLADTAPPSSAARIGGSAIESTQVVAEAVDEYFKLSASHNAMHALAKSTDSMLEWVQIIRDQLSASNAEPRKGREFIDLVDSIADALDFVQGCGIDVSSEAFREPEFFTCRRPNELWFEAALARKDPLYGHGDAVFSSSAHMLSLSGSALDDPQWVKFASEIANPVALSVNAGVTPEALIQLVRKLNPQNMPGRIVLVVGMGADELWKKMPPLLKAVQKARDLNVLWMCDPICENNIVLENGVTTRPFDLITAEIETFFSICDSEGVMPGGLRIEMTSDNVSEIFGGSLARVSMEKVQAGYDGTYAPRLNATQAIEIAYEAGLRLRELRKRK
ncbi:Phospho-2-dehydro-3-deoxyheptonate aldolase 2, chloroplastic [Porphyridium purpureum]|uniref:Phospho-2-dehydro-3-deoxyheptonate aldolase n=1 Tax=Porphyridium purpureum TaxID=35688 RepID=A0A5J4Z062_PORPP|nr:Phospho-2-dehydro-3-deoxyheptonate aldolase 2, chloroplastic [Porphyridium purpureum]|eukprot:POR0560..scf209_3